MRSRLLTQVLAVNLLLIAASVLIAALAVGGPAPLGGHPASLPQDREALVLVLALVATLLGNWLLLHRRFEPLEHVLSEMERIDLTAPSASELPKPGSSTAEVRRLDSALRRLVARLEAERREAGRAVVQAQERERRRIAQDLHDEVNQALTAVSLRLQASIAQAPAELRGELAETKRLVGQAMTELLALARQLRPPVLDDHGLVPALRTQLRDFAAQAGLQASFRVEGEESTLTPEQDLVVYRVTQESLSNVAQHAGAVSVDVALALGSPTVLRISDDGSGFEPDALELTHPDRGGRLGLSGMRERALLVGGRLSINSAPGLGTCVELALD